jgi:hypothetical protein
VRLLLLPSTPGGRSTTQPPTIITKDVREPCHRRVEVWRPLARDICDRPAATPINPLRVGVRRLFRRLHRMDTNDAPTTNLRLLLPMPPVTRRGTNNHIKRDRVWWRAGRSTTERHPYHHPTPPSTTTA